jgi:hypothetical protein
MGLAREAQKPEARRRPITRLSGVLEPKRTNHQPPWQKPVQRETARVNVERMVQHEQRREPTHPWRRHARSARLGVRYTRAAGVLDTGRGADGLLAALYHRDLADARRDGGRAADADLVQRCERERRSAKE